MVSNDKLRESKITPFLDTNFIIDMGNVRLYIIVDANFFNETFKITYRSHKHSVHELFYVKKGSGKIFVGNCEYEIKKNHIYIIEKGVFHSQHKDNVIEGYSFQFHFEEIKDIDENDMPKDAQKLFKLFENMKSCVVDGGSLNLTDMIVNIHKEMEEMHFGYAMRIQAYFIHIMIGLLRLLYAGTSLEKQFHKEPHPNEAITKTIERFFSYHVNKKCKPIDLAKQLGVCERQLYRILKKAYQTSFKEKLLETKVEVAKDLLKRTNLPISSISEMVGYSEPSNFSNMFQRKTGLSASEYKKSCAKDSEPI